MNEHILHLLPPSPFPEMGRAAGSSPPSLSSPCSSSVSSCFPLRLQVVAALSRHLPARHSPKWDPWYPSCHPCCALWLWHVFFLSSREFFLFRVNCSCLSPTIKSFLNFCECSRGHKIVKKKLIILFLYILNVSLLEVYFVLPWLHRAWAAQFISVVVVVVLLLCFHYGGFKSQSLAFSLVQKSHFVLVKKWDVRSLKYLWDGETWVLNLVKYKFWLLS